MLIDAADKHLFDKLYEDSDPWNTEWVNALHHVRRYTRRRRRTFLDLWLDELRLNRVQHDLSGLQARYGSISGYASSYTIV